MGVWWDVVFLEMWGGGRRIWTRLELLTWRVVWRREGAVRPGGHFRPGLLHHLTVVLLLLLVIGAAQLLRVALQHVAPRTRVVQRAWLRPHQVGGQAQLLLQGGPLEVGAADHSEVTVLQRPAHETFALHPEQHHRSSLGFSCTSVEGTWATTLREARLPTGSGCREEPPAPGTSEEPSQLPGPSAISETQAWVAPCV